MKAKGKAKADEKKKKIQEVANMLDFCISELIDRKLPEIEKRKS